MDESEVIKEKEVTASVRQDENEMNDERSDAQNDRAVIEPASGSRPAVPSFGRNRRLHAWIVLSLVLMVCEGYFLLRSSPGLPRNLSTADDYSVLIGRKPMIVSQTFTTGVSRLRAIELWTIASPALDEGWVRLELVDIGRDGGLAASGEVSMTNMFAHSRYRFAFAPIVRSEGRSYRLDIHFPGVSDEQAPGLLATRTSTYRGGALVVDGSAVSGDLLFSTDAVGGTALRRFEHAVGVSAGSVAWRALFAIGFILYNIGLAGLLVVLMSRQT